MGFGSKEMQEKLDNFRARLWSTAKTSASSDINIVRSHVGLEVAAASIGGGTRFPVLCLERGVSQACPDL